MAWTTYLDSGDELVIDGRSIIRVSERTPAARIVVEVVPGADRHEIMKRPRTDRADGK